MLHFLLPRSLTFVSKKKLKKMNRYHFYLALAVCWLIALHTSSAQSFLKFYNPPQNFDLQPQSVFEYPNGDFGVAVRRTNNVVGLLRTDPAGTQISFTAQVTSENTPHFRELDGSVVTAGKSGDSLVVWERDPAQNIVWRTAIRPAPNSVGFQVWDVRENNAEEVFVTGYYYVSGFNHFYYYTAKFAADGTFLWKKDVVTNDYLYSFGVAPDNDGGGLSGWPVLDTMLPSPAPLYSLLTRYLPDGTVAWESRTYPNLSLTSTAYGINDADQSLLVQSEMNQSNDTTRLLLLDPTGDTVWYRYLADVPEMCQLQARVVLPIGNNGFYVLGENYLDNLNQINATVAKVNIDGSIAWVRTFPNQVFGQMVFTAGRVLSDESIVAAGYRINNQIVLLKISADGDLNSYQNTIEGRVILDNNDNCVADSGEAPLEGWAVTAKGPDYSLFAVTDAQGRYKIPFVNDGAYQVFLSPPSYVWQSCPDTATVFFVAGGLPVSDTANFLVQTPVDCPVLQASIAAPNFRRCVNLNASAQICNYGNVAAVPAELRIVPDPHIFLFNFSHPNTLEGDTLVFTFDSLAPMDCRVVTMTAFIDCNVPLGQTLCMEATARPDAICLPPSDVWSGASIEVGGACEGDSVRLFITNKGVAPTSQPVGYVIIDDHVITYQDAASLAVGEKREEVVPANGHTWRLTATQEPGHPLGNQDPTVAVEGCTVTGNFTTGMVNLFANHSGNGLGDIFCKEVIGSYDPNDKTGFPYGVDEPHCIEAGQEMEYLIRFQNTGTDTAFRVEIRDTLSHWLSPASIRPGASSHPYTWKLSGEGILSVLFDDIMLPDSNVNEAASNGFVTFRIAQQPNNPIGAVIYNQAAIYFDENEPVLTNTPYQTVCKDFLEVRIVSTPTVPSAEWQVHISPNPAIDVVNIRLPENTLQNGEVVLRDALGRQMRRLQCNGSGTEIQRNGMAAGLYFVEVLENGVRVAVEKVMWQ